MQSCAVTTTTFTLTNIIQFGIVIRVITPPVKCYVSCITSAMVGSMILPCFIVMDHMFRSNMNWMWKISFIFVTTCIPFVSSVCARVALNYCFDDNWYVWLVQGSTIPAMFWTTYNMIFDESSTSQRKI
jgi:hypothetical protein